jgi:pyridoxine 5-phosphate synthase
MTKLSVNVNKIATIRNARGGDMPNLIQVVRDCEAYGAEGITVHPRPDERHIRYQDVRNLKPILTTEFNIELNHNRDFIISTSIFVGTHFSMIEGAKKVGADRVELYTEPYATDYPTDKVAAIAPFVKAAEYAKTLGLGINAGHDLSLENLAWFSKHIPFLDEVSIGHALICDALYLGLEETVKRYKACLR